MNFTTFAEKYHLRVRRDSCGDQIALGKTGHLFQFDENLMGLALISPNDDDPKLDNTLRARKRKVVAAGFLLLQEGDFESVLAFDPADHTQAKLAVKLVGAKPRRKPSVAQLEVLRKAREVLKSRPKHCAEGVKTTQNGVSVSERGKLPDPMLVGAFRPSTRP